jgi:serine/threonine protein kinase
MSLYRQLNDYCLVTSPLGDQVFLPLSDLNDKITRDSIKAQLSYGIRLFHRGLPDNVFLHAKKVFAILVLIEEPCAIKDLIQEGLTDEDLPLSRKGDSDYNVLVSACGKIFKSFASWDKESRVRDFLDKQWLVQAPVLDTTGKHIVLDPKCALPFQESVAKARGGFGVVHQGTLHPAHQQGFKVSIALASGAHRTIDAKVPKAGAGLQIAIKEFRTEENFVKEKENLQMIQRLQHKHLIKLVATCQSGPLYYVMFPWADGGNLKDFWTREDSRQRTPELILWSLQQMLGLVDALKALHRANIRHGDLKPENILHFKECDDLNKSGEGILVIADVGVSRFHREVTSMRNIATSTMDVTFSYEAPEAQFDQGKPRPRRYDMWSMGCMFLEFTVWLVYDLNAVKSFRKSRKSKDDPKTAPGNFYRCNSKGAAEIHSAVFEAMDKLREDPRCKGGTALEDFVQLIAERLLLIEVSHRAEATELYDKLEKIVRNAEEKPSYLLNKVDPPPAIPDFFRRVGSRQNSASSPFVGIRRPANLVML